MPEYDLKPCPFCGSEDVTLFEPDDEAEITGYWINCPDCGMATDTYATEERVVELWNRRVPNRRQRRAKKGGA